MKKLFSIILLASLTFGAVALSAHNASAQVTMTQTDPAGASATVNTNADTSYHLVDLAGQTNNYNVLGVFIKGTKTSGTVAGAVTLWGSIDNSRWYAVYGASTSQLADTVTSQTLTDGDVDFQFLVDKTRYRYYRVRVITTGTQVSSYVCKALGRKVPN